MNSDGQESKSVLEFVAVGEEPTTSLCPVVNGGGSCHSLGSADQRKVISAPVFTTDRFDSLCQKFTLIANRNATVEMQPNLHRMVTGWFINETSQEIAIKHAKGKKNVDKVGNAKYNQGSIVAIKYKNRRWQSENQL